MSDAKNNSEASEVKKKAEAAQAKSAKAAADALKAQQEVAAAETLAADIARKESQSAQAQLVDEAEQACRDADKAVEVAKQRRKEYSEALALLDSAPETSLADINKMLFSSKSVGDMKIKG